MRSFLLAAIACLMCHAAHAQPARVDSLLAAMQRSAAVQDSLSVVRRSLRSSIEQMASRVDSLKAVSGAGRASGALREALSQAVDLVGQETEASRESERIDAAIKSARGAARDAIERELARLTGGLSESPGPSAVDRITRLRQWRYDLAVAAQGVAEQADVPAVRLSDEDGPDEIQQKVDLVSDMAAHLQRDADAVRNRLGELELERRLRERLSSLANEVSLFDEDVAQARSIVGGLLGGDEKVLAGAGEESGRAPGTADDALQPSGPGEAGIVAGVEVPGAAPQPTDLGQRGDVGAEIARLNATLKALTARRDTLRKQAEAFRARFGRMLEEGP